MVSWVTPEAVEASFAGRILIAEADGVFPELGDPPGDHVSLHELKELVAS